MAGGTAWVRGAYHYLAEHYVNVTNAPELENDEQHLGYRTGLRLERRKSPGSLAQQGRPKWNILSRPFTWLGQAVIRWPAAWLQGNPHGNRWQSRPDGLICSFYRV
jgi:hypothetical protein